MKMNAVTFFILIVCFAPVANASDFKTIGGKEYKDATVKRVEPDGIVLVTKWGISKIYFTELPKEVQDRFAYDAGQSRASSTAKQDTRPELIPTNQAAQQPTEGASQPVPHPNSSRSNETALDHTYEITRDYVIGGDTGKVAMRLRRGDRYRGRIFPHRAELHIDGISYTVPSDILSASKD